MLLRVQKDWERAWKMNLWWNRGVTPLMARIVRLGLAIAVSEAEHRRSQWAVVTIDSSGSQTWPPETVRPAGAG
jgi:hypothetical protein